MKKLWLFIFLFLVFINVKAEEEYVTDIVVDGSTIAGFDVNKTEYNLGDVSSSKESITIGYSYDKNKYQGMGSIGSLTLKYGKNEFSFTLTNNLNSEDTKTYKIIVNRPDNRDSDNSLSSLTVGNQKVVLSDLNEYNISVDAKITSVEIKPVKTISPNCLYGAYQDKSIIV